MWPEVILHCPLGEGLPGLKVTSAGGRGAPTHRPPRTPGCRLPPRPPGARRPRHFRTVLGGVPPQRALAAAPLPRRVVTASTHPAPPVHRRPREPGSTARGSATAVRARCCCFHPQRRKPRHSERLSLSAVGTAWNLSRPTTARVPFRCSRPPPPPHGPPAHPEPRSHLLARGHNDPVLPCIVLPAHPPPATPPTWNSCLAQSEPW